MTARVLLHCKATPALWLVDRAFRCGHNCRGERGGFEATSAQDPTSSFANQNVTSEPYPMDRLPPIPSPPGHLWREVRFRVLPLLAFAAGCALVAVLWIQEGGGRSLPGVGEGVRTAVLSPQPAVILELLVEPYSSVQQGEPIAVVKPYDPRADLDLLRSRLEIARLRTTPTLTETHAVDRERLRMDLLQTRSELAVARVRLGLAEGDLARNTPLFRQKLVTEEIYELSRSTRDMYQAEVDEKAAAVSGMEQRLKQLEQAEIASAPTSLQDDLFERLETSQSAAETNWAPVTLVAPINGTLGMFLRNAGEFVIEGETLVTVLSDRADRIVGYLRQPFGFEPRPGLDVMVSLRSGGRKRFMSEIKHVGAQFEVITNSLALVRDGMLVDSGLPVIVEVPAHIHIRPGEVVDLLIKRRSGAPGSSLAFGERPDPLRSSANR
jgi:multidrug resistance efflux pump